MASGLKELPVIIQDYIIKLTYSMNFKICHVDAAETLKADA